MGNPVGVALPPGQGMCKMTLPVSPLLINGAFRLGFIAVTSSATSSFRTRLLIVTDSGFSPSPDSRF